MNAFTLTEVVWILFGEKDRTNDLTPHQANTGDPLYDPGAPDAQSERLERSLCLALNERQKG